MILAWENKADAATITAGSEIATLPATNLQDVHVAKKWHTQAGVKSSHLLIDFGEPVALSMLALLGSNLSERGTVRARASMTDATATGSLALDSGILPARAKAGYGAIYKHLCRGKYLSLASDEVPTFALDFTSGSVAPLIGGVVPTFARAGAVCTYVGPDGYLKRAAANEIRFERDPLTGRCLGYLPEGPRTNLCLRSEELDNGAVWGKTQDGAVITTVIPNAAIAPDGTLTADKIVEGDGVNGHGHGVRQSFGVLAGEKRTLSWWVKAGERFRCSQWSFGSVAGVQDESANAVFDMAAATVAVAGVKTTKIKKYRDGWYRCSRGIDITGNGTLTIHIGAQDASTTQGYAGSSKAGIYVWGVQLEEALNDNGYFPTSYIPTTDATAFRSQDELRYPTAGWFTNLAGTTAVVFHEPPGYEFNARLVADLATAATMLSLTGDPPTGVSVYDNLNSVNAAQAVPLGPGPHLGVGAYQAGQLAACINGLAVQTAGAYDGDICGPTMQVGGAQGGTYVNTPIERITYYPKRLADAKMQSRGALVNVANVFVARYWRIDIEDTTLPDNLQVGRLFLGPSWETPQNQGAGLEFGWGVTPHDPSEEEESAGGQTYPEERPQRRVLQFSLDWGTEQEMYENVFAMARAAGVVRDVLAIPRPDSAYISEQAVWGQLQAPQPLVHRTSRTFRQQFTVKERL